MDTKQLTIRLRRREGADDATFLAEYCRMNGYPIIEESVTVGFSEAEASELATLVRDIKSGHLVPVDESLKELDIRLDKFRQSFNGTKQ